MAPQNWGIYIYINIYITCLKQIGIQGSHETKLHSDVVSNTARLHLPTSSVCILAFHLLISRWLLLKLANPEGSGLLFWFWLKCLEAPWANTMFKVFITVSWSHLDGWLGVGTILQVEVIGSVEIIFDCGNYTPDLWKTQLILVSSAIFHGVSPVFHGVSPLYSVIFLSTTLPRCLPANLRLV